jgi:hypothetical protein
METILNDKIKIILIYEITFFLLFFKWSFYYSISITNNNLIGIVMKIWPN